MLNGESINLNIGIHFHKRLLPASCYVGAALGGVLHWDIVTLGITSCFSVQEHKWIGQLRPSESNRVFNISAMISSMLTENAVYKVKLNS